MSTKQPNMPGYVAGMSEEELRERFNVEEIIKLGSNENPIGPSPLAVEAIRRVVDSTHRYPPMSDDALKTAFAQHAGEGVSRDQIVTGNGACDLLSMIADAYLNSESSCVICPPTFPVYEFTAKRNGASVLRVDLTTPDLEFDIESIVEAIGDDTRIVYLCSPNNPTGTLLTQSQFDTITDAIPGDTMIVFDDVYHHFVTDEEAANPVERIESSRKIIAVRSFSKVYGLAGMRLGYAVAHPDVASRIAAYRLPFHINALTTQAGLAAIGDRDHITNTVATVVRGRDFLIEKLSSMEVDIWPSQANFVLIKVENSGAVVEELMKAGIIVRPMDTFYLPGYLRVTVGRKDDNERFIEVLRSIID